MGAGTLKPLPPKQSKNFSTNISTQLLFFFAKRAYSPHTPACLLPGKYASQVYLLKAGRPDTGGFVPDYVKKR